MSYYTQLTTQWVNETVHDIIEEHSWDHVDKQISSLIRRQVLDMQHGVQNTTVISLLNEVQTYIINDHKP